MYGTICFCHTQNPVYSINGTQCIDNNECLVNNGGCEDRCINTQGSYQCACPEGFQLGANRHECDDVDECRTGRNVCPQNTFCVNTYGAYHCLAQGSGAFAAITGGIETVSTAVNTVTGGMSNTMLGVVIAILLTLNAAVVVLLAVWGVKRVRARRQLAQEAKNGFSNGAFSSNTINTMNSFPEKAHDDFDAVSIASASTISN